MESPEIHLVQEWLEQVIIGLGLCPFAAEPWHAGRVRLQVTTADSEPALLDDLRLAINQLQSTDSGEIETTILIVANLLVEFPDYNHFLGHTEQLLRDNGWEGEFQIASFHPRYQFADTQPGDLENLTNRAPYPLLHILRESSVTMAVENHADTLAIPDNNIATLRSLTPERRREIFGFLPGSNAAE